MDDGNNNNIYEILAQVFDCVKYFPVGQTHNPPSSVKVSEQVWHVDEVVQTSQWSGQPIIIIICDYG